MNMKADETDLMIDQEICLPQESSVWRFVRLRIDWWLFVLSLGLLLAFVFGLKWKEKLEQEELMQLLNFEVVEMQLPAAPAQPKNETVPTEFAPIEIEDERVEEEIIEEEEEEIIEEETVDTTYFFGDDSGEFSMGVLAATPPSLVSDMVDFPKEFREAGIEGTLIIEIGFGADGSVLYGRVIKNLHPEIDQYVVDWLQNEARFLPGLGMDGEPAAMKLNFPFNFTLE